MKLDMPEKFIRILAGKGLNTVRKLLAWGRFIMQYRRFSSVADDRFPLQWKDRWPCLLDHTIGTGFDHHYVFHTAWAARLIARNAPERHVDFSSCLRFATLVSAFVPMDFYDYRPAELPLEGLKSGHADLTNLHFENDSIASLSCMHVVEHIGLGRYGDPLDAKGDLKAINEIKRVLQPGGNLYFVVPIGIPRIQFNAHRIYSYKQVVELFDSLTLQQFSLIPDAGSIVYDAAPALAEQQRYGCGCFWFTKEAGR